MRQNLKSAFILLVNIGCLGLSVISWAAQSSEALTDSEHLFTPPNIILILADDMGWKDVGYNQSPIQTPNIDALAKSGVRLDRFYAQPTCSPTRTALMTGQAAMRNGVIQPIDKNLKSSLPLSVKILPQWFKQAGYQTVMSGKWHLGHAKQAQLPMARGFGSVYGNLLGGIGYWDHVHGGGLDWHRDGKALREPGYSTHLIADEAIAQIENRESNKPLFLYASFTAPHAPNEAPEASIAKYQHIKSPNRRAHAAMVDELDQAIGRIVKAVDDAGIRSNTLIWFMSDNGGLKPGASPPAVEFIANTAADWLGVPVPFAALEFIRSSVQDGGSDNGPYRRGKGSVYEGGVLVPAVVSWPGVLAPRQLKGRVTVQDILPTLAEVAGIELSPSHTLDGSSRWQSLQDGSQAQVNDYVIQGFDGEAYYSGRWKLVMAQEIELYDLQADPLELNNVREQNLGLAKRLQQLLVDFPRGESIHHNSLLAIMLDPDRFGGEEDRKPWVEMVAP